MKKLIQGILMTILGLSLLAGCTEVEMTAEETKEKASTEDGTESTAPVREDDGVFRILMVGNSFCYYFTDELYGLLKVAGIKASVSNVYASGCPLNRHVSWYREGNAEYEFITYDENGRSVEKHVDLKHCLEAYDYDYISIQQHFYPGLTENDLEAYNSCVPHAADLMEIIRTHRPASRILWHETWAYQIGYDRGVDSTILSLEAQTRQYNVIRKCSYTLAEDLDLLMVPSGDAWQIARADERIGDVLCNDSTRNDGLGDNYHDGNIGGGQYLNACVWFEVLTGKSAAGNLFYPDYAITRDQMKALQEAAHKAVEDCRKP